MGTSESGSVTAGASYANPRNVHAKKTLDTRGRSQRQLLAEACRRRQLYGIDSGSPQPLSNGRDLLCDLSPLLPQSERRFVTVPAREVNL